jgi:hypothetical protein
LVATLEQLEENEEIRLLGAVINAAQVPLKDVQSRGDLSIPDGNEADIPQPGRSQPQERVPVGVPFDI